jgi:hypothetical protein
MCTRAQVRC